MDRTPWIVFAVLLVLAGIASSRVIFEDGLEYRDATFEHWKNSQFFEDDVDPEEYTYFRNHDVKIQAKPENQLLFECTLEKHKADALAVPNACDGISIAVTDEENYKYFAYSTNNFEEVLVGKDHDELIFQFVAQMNHDAVPSHTRLRFLEDGFSQESYNPDTPAVLSFEYHIAHKLTFGDVQMTIGGKPVTWKKKVDYSKMGQGNLFRLVLKKDESYIFMYGNLELGRGLLREDFKYMDDRSKDGNLVDVDESFDVFNKYVSGVGVDGVAKGNGYIMFGFIAIVDSNKDSMDYVDYIKSSLEKRNNREPNKNMYEEYKDKYFKQVSVFD
jgi:hypothetical protein